LVFSSIISPIKAEVPDQSIKIEQSGKVIAEKFQDNKLTLNEVFTNNLDSSWIELFNPSDTNISTDNLIINIIDSDCKNIISSNLVDLSTVKVKNFLTIDLPDILPNSGIVSLIKGKILLDEIEYGNCSENIPPLNNINSIGKLNESDVKIGQLIPSKNQINKPYIVKEVSDLNIVKPEPITVLAPSIPPTITPTISPTIPVINYSDWKIAINEIFPSPSTGKEWVELYNNSGIERDLTGWVIDDSTTTAAKCITISNKSDYIIAPFSYLLLYCSSSVLNNSGDEVYLFSPDNIQQDYYKYTSTNSDESWNKFTSGWEKSNEATPGSENVRIEVVDYSKWNIKINEVMPFPSEGEEWVELYNNDNVERDLSNWIIKDSSGSTKKLTAIIPTNGYSVIKFSSIFNNTGDSVFLYDPNSVERDNFTYGSSEKGSSWSLIEGKWIITNRPTPGSMNLPGLIINNEVTIPIIEARKLDNDSVVNISGTVTVEANKLYKNVFYIEDQTGGIRVESDETITVSVGDFVNIRGAIDEIRNEKRILADKIEIVGISTLPIARAVKLTDLKEVNEGRLVKIKGTVSATNGSTVEVTDGKNKAIVYISSLTGIKKPYTRSGYFILASGILTQYGEKDGDPYYRLMPRYQADFSISKSALLADTGNIILPNIILANTIILSLVMINYKKLKFWKKKA